MKIHDVEQKSVEWMLLRSGIPTASEFDNLITPKFKAREGQTPQTYMASKLAEWWLGGPLAQFNSFDMEMGNVLEDEAIPWYELEFGTPVTRVGFITSDDGRIGCSPDGLIGDDGGIEIKCPAPQTHVKYLLGGNIPDDYLVQVYGSLYVSGRRWWKFLSYRRRFPPLLITVERDEEIMEKIGGALDNWLDTFELAKKRMIHLNGGVEPRRQSNLAGFSNLTKQSEALMGDDIIP